MKRFRFGGEQAEAESINIAQEVLLLLSQGSTGVGVGQVDYAAQPRTFECKTCNRQFPSFQALGGHRASHKRPRLAGDAHGEAPAQPMKPRVHECTVCGLEFTIGQALGGHMRRHRTVASEEYSHESTEQKPEKGRGLGLDLNLTPPENDVAYTNMGLGLGLGLVDCFH